ncbi:MAG: sugar O-acetyltransferase [Lachnospiraceae bacterium]|nr:sugar O-acetyltransferase [Lachnospiraceae bacterium]
MTEYEKMISSKLYNSTDPELIKLRSKAQDLCYEYNLLRPSDKDKQQDIMNRLLGSIGSRYEIRAPFYCDYGFNISIGENFFANFNTVFIDCSRIVIGNNVMFGPNCCIDGASHPTDSIRRNAGFEYAYPITIEDDVWLGSGVHIMPGITIGRGCVIGAGSIVTKDIPPYSLAVGNPCHVIREITDEDRARNWDR